MKICIYLILNKKKVNTKEEQADTFKKKLSNKLRKEFIENLEKTYKNRLEQKLDKRLEINLEYKNTGKGFEAKEQTYFPEDMKNEKEVGSNLADIYEQNNTLVILGEPGSGKTSQLLNLAIELLQRAKKDTNISIPIIINLAPWKVDNDFAEWIQNAIINLYNYPKNIIQLSINNDEIALFLDGFDEIGITFEDRNELRTNFINALTKFIKQTQKDKIVLCSRVTEYENTKKYNWRFLFNKNNAQILVKPITKEKIRETLKTSKYPIIASELLNYFETNEKIKVIITTPFYFNAILFIIEQNHKLNFPDNEPEISNYITRTYIDLKLNSQKNDKYSTKKSKRYLKWLAIWLKNKQNVTFELADFYPKDLHKSMFFNVLYGLSGSFVGGSIFYIIGGLVFGLYGSVILGLVFGLLLGYEKRQKGGVYTEDILKINWQKLKKIKVWINILEIGLSGSLIFGFVFGLIVYLVFDIDAGLVFGIVAGIVVGFVFSLLTQLGEVDFFSHLDKPYKRLRAHIKRDIILWSIVWFFLIFGFNLIYRELSIVKSFFTATPVFLIIPLLTILISPLFKFRIINFLLKKEGALPWRMDTFFDYLVEINILEKNGGFWRFRHQIIHDYFLNEQNENN